VLASALLMQTAQAADYTNSIGLKFTNIPAGSFWSVNPHGIHP